MGGNLEYSSVMERNEEMLREVQAERLGKQPGRVRRGHRSTFRLLPAALRERAGGWVADGKEIA
jgi:hypothetical protein